MQLNGSNQQIPDWIHMPVRCTFGFLTTSILQILQYAVPLVSRSIIYANKNQEHYSYVSKDIP